jgi:hypothetical protein
MKHQDDPRSQVLPEDQSVIDLVAAQYSPPPMTAIRRAAFRQRLSDRMVQTARKRWALGFASVAGAAAALLLVVRWQPVSMDDTAAMSADTPLLYAYVDPDEYSADSMRD